MARYPYDVSKACTDLIARSYAVTYEMPVAVSRLANVYGGGDMNFSRLVPDTARSLVRASAGDPIGRKPRAGLDLRGGRRGRLSAIAESLDPRSCTAARGTPGAGSRSRSSRWCAR